MVASQGGFFFLILIKEYHKSLLLWEQSNEVVMREGNLDIKHRAFKCIGYCVAIPTHGNKLHTI